MRVFCFKSFYLDLRKRHHSKDSTPITTRQLESLMRLTEARARLELREVSTAQDAEEVVEIMKYRYRHLHSDGTEMCMRLKKGDRIIVN